MDTIVTSEQHEVNTSSSELDSNATPISIVQVSIPNQPVQVQSVIQAPQIIQTSSGQTIHTIQVTPVASDDDDAEGRKRHEILARRPSYRRILNELSADTTTITVAKIEEPVDENTGSPTSQEDSQEGNEAATNLIVPAAQTIHLSDGTTQGIQTLTMTNVAGQAQAGATIVQYAQGPDGQFFIPEMFNHHAPPRVSTINAGGVQAYQITTPASLPQGVVMATSGATIASPQQLSEEAARKRELRLLKNSMDGGGYDVNAPKRELRLLKNREAARECRKKKKVPTATLR